MERPVKGDIVVMRVPFSDLSATKKRPAIIIASLSGEDYILCQITSQKPENNFVELSDKDYFEGKLSQKSFIRLDKMFTLEKSLMEYRAAKVKKEKMLEIEQGLIRIIKA
jgi:mRNA interferase MazF